MLFVFRCFCLCLYDLSCIVVLGCLVVGVLDYGLVTSVRFGLQVFALVSCGWFVLFVYSWMFSVWVVVFVIAFSWWFCVLDVASLRLFPVWIAG